MHVVSAALVFAVLGSVVVLFEDGRLDLAASSFHVMERVSPSTCVCIMHMHMHMGMPPCPYGYPCVAFYSDPRDMDSGYVSPWKCPECCLSPIWRACDCMLYAQVVAILRGVSPFMPAEGRTVLYFLKFLIFDWEFIKPACQLASKETPCSHLPTTILTSTARACVRAGLRPISLHLAGLRHLPRRHRRLSAGHYERLLGALGKSPHRFTAPTHVQACALAHQLLRHTGRLLDWGWLRKPTHPRVVRTLLIVHLMVNARGDVSVCQSRCVMLLPDVPPTGRQVHPDA
jgi:hypothetical protein